MTIIATYRIDDRAIYVNDFRVTMRYPDRQLDISFKFRDFEGRLGLFLAGDVDLWRTLLPTINEILCEISLDNILEFHGPFRSRVQCEVERLPNTQYGASGAIGFLIDDKSRQNVQFVIRLYPGQGCTIQEVGIGECIVIGSGQMIPNISDQLINRCRTDIQNIGEDLYGLGQGMRQEIQNNLQKCGSTSFRKLGISPCMSISTLAGSHFMIRGEELQGESFSPNNHHSYHFTFERNSDGYIALIDHIRNRETIVSDIENIDIEIEGDVFDPQNLTIGEDPTELYPDATAVYLFKQFIIPNYRTVWRSIDKISFFSFHDENMCDPNYNRIANYIVEYCRSNSIQSYTHLDKGYFIVSENYIAEFETQIQNRMFDHEWLNLMIQDYNRFYQE